MTILIVFSLCRPSAALARATSFNANQYRPSPFTDRILTVDGSAIQPALWLSLGLDADYSKGVMARTPRGGAKQDIVDDLIVAHFLASGVVFDRLSLGIEFPFALYENYISPTTLVSENRTRLGDLLFAMKFNILDGLRYPLGIAISPFVTVPTGSGNSFMGNNSFAGGGKLIMDVSVKTFKAALNVGYMARDKVNILGTTIDDRLLYGLGISFRFYDRWCLLAEVQGSTVASNAFQQRAQSPLEADVAMSYDIPSSRFKVFLGGGAGIVRNSGAPLFRVSTGVNYQFGKDPWFTEPERERWLAKQRMKDEQRAQREIERTQERSAALAKAKEAREMRLAVLAEEQRRAEERAREAAEEKARKARLAEELRMERERKAEEARIARERQRELEAERKEQARLEKLRAKEAAKAEKARIEQEREIARIAEAKEVREMRLAALAEEQRRAEVRAREAAEEKARRAAEKEARRLEEERLAEQKRVADLHEKQLEAEREEQARIEKARALERERAESARRKDEARQAKLAAMEREQELMLARETEAQRLEEIHVQRKAEEEARRAAQEDARRLEEERLAEEKRVAELHEKQLEAEREEQARLEKVRAEEAAWAERERKMAARPAEPEAVEPGKEDRTWNLMKRLEKVVYFPAGETIITYETKNRLADVPELMATDELVHLSIISAGFSDTTGSEDVNMALSIERAEAVKEYLVSIGVDSSRIFLVGYGEQYPVDTSGTEIGRARNRRVEIHFAITPNPGEN